MSFVSPLRYPGGKGKLANYIKLIFSYNDLLDGHYVEPYAGGAAVALTLLYSEYATHIHINDVSKPLFALWYSILNDTDEFCALIQDTKISIDEWHRQKSIQEQFDQVSLLELGFSTFFLNRTNRSGILRGGVIGGKKQEGIFKLSARYNKTNLLQRIKRVALYKDRISLYNDDAEKFIKSINTQLPERTLYYFDPPYYIKGKGLYEDFYEHQDHLNIFTMIDNLKHKWIVSYDKTKEIQDMYKDYQQVTYSLSYSTAEHYKGNEVMFFSDNLIVPPIKVFTKISSNAITNILQRDSVVEKATQPPHEG